MTEDVGIARDLELEEEPEDGTELLNFMIKLYQVRSYFLWMKKKKKKKRERERERERKVS